MDEAVKWPRSTLLKGVKAYADLNASAEAIYFGADTTVEGCNQSANKFGHEIEPRSTFSHKGGRLPEGARYYAKEGYWYWPFRLLYFHSRSG